LFKKYLFTLLILGILCYAAGFLNLPAVFIILLAIFFYLFFYMLVLAASRTLPAAAHKRIKENKLTFVPTFVVWLTLFLLGIRAINKYYMAGAFPIMRILSVGLFLVIALVLGWLMLAIKRYRKTTSAACAVAHILFIVLAPFVSGEGSQNEPDYDPSDPDKSMNLSGRILSSLPYVDWTPSAELEKVSVTRNEPEHSFKGINIFNSMALAQAYLVDMEGKILHTWSDSNSKNRWNEHVELCRNGDLLVILKDQMLMRFDWDSTIKWTNKLRCHHEIIEDKNDDIYVLSRRDEMAFVAGFPVPVLSDYIAVISSDGKIKKEIPILKAVKKHIPFRIVPEIYLSIINPGKLMNMILRKGVLGYLCVHGSAFDIFHNNRISIIDQDIKGVCKKGDVLICIRELDLIGILDIENEEFTWTWGPGELSRPHYPTLLANGNILVFDNGRLKQRSRVIELDPVTNKIVWEYKTNPPQDFYSPLRGSCQRLPNGNTLITESNRGRAFEVMGDGTIVWEFFNPEIDTESEKRAIIYRMIRIIEPENYSSLKDLY
jgi:hypothetical protein